MNPTNYEVLGLARGDNLYSLSEMGGIHERHFGYHRKIASRHPFLIYYRMVTTGVEVVAVLDGRSRPTDIDALLQQHQAIKETSLVGESCTNSG